MKMNIVRATGNAADYVLIIGPWLHNVNNPKMQKIGERDAGPTGIIKLDQIHDESMNHHMLVGPPPNLPNVMYFLPVKNEWRAADASPPPATQFTQYFLGSRGKTNTNK